jgi:hypothetical protein
VRLQACQPLQLFGDATKGGVENDNRQTTHDPPNAYAELQRALPSNSATTDCRSHFCHIPIDEFQRDISATRKMLASAADIRFGSEADICSPRGYVRFTPDSGHVRCSSKSGHQTTDW